MLFSQSCKEFKFFTKKDIQHFYIGPILFSENKNLRSVVGRKVDGKILFGARSEKRKIVFGARGEKWTNWCQMTVTKNFIWLSKG